jgi:hypothetical protein
MAAKECCQKPENLKEEYDPRPEFKVFVCQICGCRHYELTVEAGDLGLKMEG